MHTRFTFTIAPTFAAGLAALACEVDDNAGAGDTAGATDTAGAATHASDGDSGSPSTPMCGPNDGNGVTSCFNRQCVNDNYCDSYLETCQVGCLSTLNCAAGEYCDLRMPSRDFGDEHDVGVCRPPGAECGTDATDPGASAGTGGADTSMTDTGTMSCADVEGNYTISLASDVPDICRSVIDDGTLCSVAQDGCQLTWGCDNAFGLGFPPGQLEGNTYHGMGTYSAKGTSVPFDCEVEFVELLPYRLTFSCSANVGAAIVCEGLGR